MPEEEASVGCDTRRFREGERRIVEQTEMEGGHIGRNGKTTCDLSYRL